MSDPSTAVEAAPPCRRWSAGRVLVITTVALMVVMWGYVLYLAFGPGRQPPPDRLADPTYATEAQAICERAHDDVDQLPRAIDAATADERAGVITEANGRFAEMVEELAAIAPTGEEGEIVGEWLADWRAYLDDRAAFADALRDDPEAQLIVTARDREQVTEYIDAFAKDNRMIACGTPIDV